MFVSDSWLKGRYYKSVSQRISCSGIILERAKKKNRILLIIICTLAFLSCSGDKEAVPNLPLRPSTSAVEAKVPNSNYSRAFPGQTRVAGNNFCERSNGKCLQAWPGYHTKKEEMPDIELNGKTVARRDLRKAVI